MSDQAPAPVATEPVAPVEPVVEPTPLHPAWERALEPIPDMLRVGIEQQIRTSDREAQAAIEAARGTIDPEWQKFLTDARTAGATPAELTAGWNAAQALQADPVKFATDLNASIDALVADGTLTRPQAQAAKQQVADAAGQQLAEPNAPLSAEAREILELKAQLEQVSTTVQSNIQQQQSAAQAQQAKAYGDAFFTEIDTQFDAAGLSAASQQTKVAVARYADTLIEADPTGTLGEKAAIAAAITKMRAASAELNGTPAPVAGAPAALPLPVGGGTTGVPGTPAKKFANDDEREAAMLAEAMRQINAE